MSKKEHEDTGEVSLRIRHCPIYQGRAGGDPAHTCVLAVVLFEGTDEVRLVSKKLLPQDFESGALGSPNAVRDRTMGR